MGKLSQTIPQSILGDASLGIKKIKGIDFIFAFYIILFLKKNAVKNELMQKSVNYLLMIV